MSSRNDIDQRLVYTCNCGWVDKGHASGKSPARPHIGAQSLWEQILNEKGTKSETGGGFKVTYGQDGRKSFVIIGFTRSYFVKNGLNREDKESVALSIFMEISVGFENMQDSWPLSWFTDSGFSVEDLVSDLIGFYSVVRPAADYFALCVPVSKTESLRIWDTFGGVGNQKNNTFRPVFFNCEECRKRRIAPTFPKELTAIKPAAKGTQFRDWTTRVINYIGGQKVDTGPNAADEVVRIITPGRPPM
ncbi:MAG TPA: hypothetical protein VM120_19675 [Bryobacteraceae bacterium]|nr:hypothetical protein [Bryobacteraceae bacterium]